MDMGESWPLFSLSIVVAFLIAFGFHLLDRQERYDNFQDFLDCQEAQTNYLLSASPDRTIERIINNDGTCTNIISLAIDLPISSEISPPRVE